MATKRVVGAPCVMMLVLAWTAGLSLNAQAFGGEGSRAVFDRDVASHSPFARTAHPNADVEALAIAQEVPAIESLQLVTLTAEELGSIAGMGALPAAPGTPTTGVVLWDERPQSSAVVGTNLSAGQLNHQTIGVTIQGP